MEILTELKMSLDLIVQSHPLLTSDWKSLILKDLHEKVVRGSAKANVLLRQQSPALYDCNAAGTRGAGDGDAW